MHGDFGSEQYTAHWCPQALAQTNGDRIKYAPKLLRLNPSFYNGIEDSRSVQMQSKPFFSAQIANVLQFF
jgi:hypothetical protein